jgi:hypothetical protein
VIFDLVIAYFVVGIVVCSLHPKLLRPQLAELWKLDLGAAELLIKPFLALAVFLLYCTIWPIGWFNSGKSEKKAKELLDIQFERLQPLIALHSAMNARASLAGGDGSSFEQAIVIVGATFISGPGAAHNYIKERFPGAKQKGQSLKEQNGKKYDVFEFTTAEGERKTMYFDVSAHFPKSDDA